MNRFLENFLMTIAVILVGIVIAALFIGGIFLMTLLPYWWDIETWARVLHALIYIIFFVAGIVAIITTLGEEDNNCSPPKQKGKEE